MKISLQPRLLQWARDRAGLDVDDVARKVGTKPERVAAWEQAGELTYKQAEKLAKVTHTPFGYLFLREPPEDRLPIPDFRTVGSTELARPSTDLLDVLYQCQRRQQWFREYLLEEGAKPLPFVASVTLDAPVTNVARSIRRRLAFHPAGADGTTLEVVLRGLLEAIENIGVLVMKSGIVGNNTRRKLDPNEFRGFALVDDYAPLVFVNGSDSRAAQLFTLVHELAHVWIGESALSNLDATYAPAQRIERFCNAVAAEYLVPEAPLRDALANSAEAPAELVQSLRKRFKVSSLVILRRLRDVGQLGDAEFRELYREQVEEFRRRDEQQADGGDYYRTQPVKVSRKFAVALVGSTLEGRTPYREAFALLDMKKPQTFKELAKRLSFPVR